MKKASDYEPSEIEQMRTMLAKSEWEGLTDKDLREILWGGCTGWKNISDEMVLKAFDEIFNLEN